MVGVALYQGYRGLTKKFLKDSKVEEMSPATKTWITRIGMFGHLARMVVFGLVGVFLVKAAIDYNPKQGSRARRRACEAPRPLLRAVAPRGRRCGPDRIRALFAERRPLSENLSGDNGQPRRPSRFDGLGAAKAKEALFAAECWFGDQLSRQICAHHRRRLRRIGWENALEPPSGGWADGDPPARSGNAVDVLIDGEQALPVIAEELLEARSHVHLTGWHFSPDFALTREGEQVLLRNLLAELAERVDVRVLVWAGAPIPLFRPSRGDVKKLRDRLTAQTKIQCALDSKERPLHCHHEKTIVIDDRVAFVGGIDLTLETGDRYDSSDHPARAGVGWHDACARIEGPAVGDVADHFRMRWQEVTGETLARPKPPAPAGAIDVQIVRTVPEQIYTATPRGDFRILESYLRAFRAAKRFIYLENQFLWSPEIAAALVDKIANPPSPDFRLVLLLPAKPISGKTTPAASWAS